MLRLFAAAILVVLQATAANGKPLELRTSKTYLDLENPSQPGVDRFGYLGGINISSTDRNFGGLSGIALTPSGDRLIAVSDRGYWLTARIVEDEKHRLVGLDNAEFGPMLDDIGQPLERGWRDAEAVELGAAGSIFVSFEREHRVWRYDVRGSLFDARPVELEAPKALRDAPKNGGIEALAVLSDGRLLAMTEDFRDQNGDLKGWLMHLGGSVPIALRASGNYKPTDFAVLPNGDLLMVERHFNHVGGLAIRVSRIDAADIKPDGLLVSEEIAVLKPPMNIDNFEGIAAVPAPGGGTWVYLLSDDNFNAVQRTLLMKFLLID
ncbi:MAG: esterase-like activity of phytase family protein [Minwuiales bacterium]|nr:esterase-like activity of phytase family protein [Minwuiales bacterium]